MIIGGRALLMLIAARFSGPGSGNLRRYGKATVFWLDDLGLVERNVVYGHAIHVTEPEIELMGRRRVSVTSHPSCNFHMRNGITPVVPLRAAGVNVAMGLDDNRRTMCRI